MPRSNSFCASGLHDVSKCTVPNVLSSVCPKAGCASESNAAPAKAIVAVLNILIMALLRGPATQSGTGGLPQAPTIHGISGDHLHDRDLPTMLIPRGAQPTSLFFELACRQRTWFNGPHGKRVQPVLPDREGVGSSRPALDATDPARADGRYPHLQRPPSRRAADLARGTGGEVARSGTARDYRAPRPERRVRP